MRTESKDVLHLYLGCECVDSEYPEEGKFKITPYSMVSYLTSGNDSFMKPILRPLSDMTEEEAKYKNSICFIDKIAAIAGNGKKAVIIHDSPQSFAWLLKQGFDLFGLIESGQAIDKTQL